MRSFHMAAVADPNLGIAYWGVALAAGGDLNIPIDDPCMRLAVEQSAKAYSLLNSASAADRLYITALTSRYASRPTPGADAPVRDPQQLSVYYALAMKEVYEKLRSTDPDSSTFYAFSLMSLRPWLWWTIWGRPSAEITAAIAALDFGLRLFPEHIGLNHALIHASEEAPVADAVKSKRSADLLFHKAPYITPHLNHMPSHTYLLLGDWDGVVKTNLKAVTADQPWAKACASAPFAPTCNELLVGHYYSHDMLFLDVGYNNQGLWEQVLPLASQLEANTLTYIGTQPGLEHYLTTKVMMMVHFGKWQMLANLPPPQPDMPSPTDPNFCSHLHLKLASAIWYFGQAMSHASLGQPTDSDVARFQLAQGCVQGVGLGWGNNTATDILNVVHWRMLERIAGTKGLKDAATQFALLGVESEDLLNYDEPPGWYISARETYGAALYLQGNYTAADGAFREDLKLHPNNSRSLYGLWQTLKITSPGAPATAAEKAFREQWKSPILPDLKDM
ncbi:hypothetical protein [Granulicella sp. dw_53]|uniref:hypothetical protein n=1 Tax=Granulicella sp. dw_53 TaxID=2719792 RepID=UPI001BD565A9|nr:hypothetical protein [Granulicella sp. dw_53]